MQAVGAISNLAAGTDDLREKVKDAGALMLLMPLQKHKLPHVADPAAAALRNLTETSSADPKKAQLLEFQETIVSLRAQLVRGPGLFWEGLQPVYVSLFSERKIHANLCSYRSSHGNHYACYK